MEISKQSWVSSYFEFKTVGVVFYRIVLKF
jgi:hypothetical protein